MGIYFFNNNDFTVRQNMKGKLLTFTEEYKGLYLVLFYSRECKYCDQLMAEFKQLPQNIMGCRFVMVNINQNPEIIEKSKQTVSPITYVPDLILYVNGLPYIRYDGPNDVNEIKNFIKDISTKLEKTSFLMEEQNQNHPQEEIPRNVVPEQDIIPEYTVGKPLCGSNRDVYGRCYLDFDNAYINS